MIRRTPALGLGALSMLLVACGGGGGSTNSTPAVNQPPTNVQINGPATGIVGHPALYQLQANDPDGDLFTFSSPNSGAVVSGATLTYAPPAPGVLSLSVVATDSRGGVSTPAVKQVTVADDQAPVWTSAATLIHNKPPSNPPATVTYVPTASDPEGDEVVFTLVAGSVRQAFDYPAAPGTLATVADTVVTATGSGSPTATFSLSTTLPAGASTSRTVFRLRAADRLAGATALLGKQTDLEVTVRVQGLNNPPVIAAFTPPTPRQSHAMTPFTLTATDPDGDPLVWSLKSVTPAAAGLALSAAGVLTWPLVPDTTPRQVTVRVDDDRGGSAERTFTLAPVADAIPVWDLLPAYGETVGGVPFHVPENQQARIYTRNRFTWLDSLSTDAEFVGGVNPLAYLGWRASVRATDADGDAVQYGIKAGSVYRNGAPLTDTTAAAYPSVHPTSGEITWAPGRTRGADAVNAATDPANWAFVMMAGPAGIAQPAAGTAAERAFSVRVLPNDPPLAGPLDSTVQGGELVGGVNIGGGTAAGGFGRPSLQEPVASDTETPGTASKWTWKVFGPGARSAAEQDWAFWDPNTLAADGHMDAIQADFGTRAKDAQGRFTGPVLPLQAGDHYPSADASGNLPSLLTESGTLAAGFYNPWIQTTTPTGTFGVKWAPVRSQYLLDRYLGPSAYAFAFSLEDQYGLGTVTRRAAGPLFGTVRLLGNRTTILHDRGVPTYAPRGDFQAEGNTASGGNRYAFSYLPLGRSAATGAAESQSGASTFGPHLFGGPAGTGGPASGYYMNLGLPTPSAGGWVTVDGLGPGEAGLYPSHPLNTRLHGPAHAAGVPGTAGGATVTFPQWAGGPPAGLTGAPAARTVTLTGAYADAEVRARLVPSASPFMTGVLNATLFEQGDGLLTARRMALPDPSGRWILGRRQANVDLSQSVAGRAVKLSRRTVTAADLDQLGEPFTYWANLRLTFSWPATVTTGGEGYAAAGAANTFKEYDLLEMAVLEASGNGRAFFTGNTPGVTPAGSARATGNFFGKFGLTVAPPAFSGTGVSRSAFPHQPVHAVTGSLWIPNNSDSALNLPNAYTTVAGGGLFCDLPWAGIRGYLAAAAGQGLATLLRPHDPVPLSGQGGHARLAVGTFAGNPSPTGRADDAHANPVLLDASQGTERVAWVWLRADSATALNAYGAWGGSVLQPGTPYSAGGGLTTTNVSYTMGQGQTNPLVELRFATPGGANQPPTGTTSLQRWLRGAFESAPMAAPGRFRAADPSADATVTDGATTAAQFDAGQPTRDGLVTNSLVVYGLRDRRGDGRALGEAGLEPGSPVLAQWWNTGSGDVLATAFPGVIKGFASAWLPADLLPVVHLHHNFVGKVQFPGHAAGDRIAKVLLQSGLAAPVGHALLADAAGCGPAVTPVRSLRIADLKANTATGTPVLGTQLDIFLGTAASLATGGPASGSFKLADGNGSGADHRLVADSTVQVTFQPDGTDRRCPSGYILSVLKVEGAGSAPATTTLSLVREIRVGHAGGKGAAQTVYLPPFRATAAALPGANQAFVLLVRSLWLEGDEGPEGNALDLEKQPFAQRVPMGYADLLSGVFVVGY